MATISRAEMQAAIAVGGVVLHNGRFYNDPLDLPSEAELAKGDPEREKKAEADMQAQIASLQAQIDSLKVAGGVKAPPAVPAPHPAVVPTQPPVVVKPTPTPEARK